MNPLGLYEPGTGLMAGDFYDLSFTAKTRLAAVIGDVSGHGMFVATDGVSSY